MIPGMSMPFMSLKFRTNISRFSFQYQGLLFFNRLSPGILISVSVSTFKKKTKETPSNLTSSLHTPLVSFVFYLCYYYFLFDLFFFFYLLFLYLIPSLN